MSTEALEGGGRLANIRRIKTYLYVIQTVMVLGIAIYLIVTGNGFSLRPFYLPINSFLYFLLIMGLVASIEGFIFRSLEMKFSKSASSKYYMAKMAQRRAAVIVLICGMLFLLVALPYMPNAAEDLLREERSTSGETIFTNKDPLGIISLTDVQLSSEDEVEAYIVSDPNYQLYSGNMEMLRLHRINPQYLVNGTVDFAFPVAELGDYHLVVEGGELGFVLERNISQTFLDFFPLMMLIYVIVYAGWSFYLIPVKKDYSKGAIYS